ncbi:OLFR [Mytilus coruscus]|uniref:OLFR n=1 Tax=Mytilus coruscus TaxID=42192 RepID=A0A6J8DM00_MYTCO|nr:OLFR [Mytilus coruscus]
MVPGFSHPDYKEVYFGTNDGSCMKRFVEYFYLNSYKTPSNEYLLSPDVIIEFKNENSCLEVYYNCRKDWDFILPVDIPNKSLAYLQMVIAGEVTIVNLFVLYIFLQKANRSPTTILLSMLAVSDTLTALFICIPTVIAYQLYHHHISFNGTVLSWNLIDYNSCIISGATHFKYAFHLLSVLITTLLSIQKTIALRFPLWSTRGLTNNRSMKGSVIALTLSIILFLPNVVIWKILSKDVYGRCCIDGDLILKYYDVYRNINLTNDILTVIAIFISLICTIYITCKLTCLRRNLPWSDNMTVRKKHLTSAITVVVICGIFIASEVLHIMTGVMFWIVTYYESNDSLVELLESIKQYSDLSLLIGFSFNFVVYLAMSTQLREKLLNGAKGIIGSKMCCNSKKNDRNSVSNSTRKYTNSNSNEP